MAPHFHSFSLNPDFNINSLEQLIPVNPAGHTHKSGASHTYGTSQSSQMAARDDNV